MKLRGLWQLCATVIVAAAHAGDPKVHVGPVTSLVVLDDQLISCSQGGIFVRSLSAADSATSGADNLLLKPAFRALALAVAPRSKDRERAGDGRLRLWVAGGRPGESGNLAMVRGREVVWEQKLANDLIYALAASPDEKNLALGAADGRVLELTLPAKLPAGGLPVREVHRHTRACRDVAYSRTGDAVVSVGLDGVILLTAKGGVRAEKKATRSLQEHTAGVEALALSAKGTVFASGARDAKVRLHQLDGRFLHTHLRVGGAVLSLAALPSTPSGEAFLAGLADGRVVRLDRRSARPQALPGGAGAPITALAVTWNRAVFAGTRGRILEWRWVGGKWRQQR